MVAVHLLPHRALPVKNSQASLNTTYVAIVQVDGKCPRPKIDGAPCAFVCLVSDRACSSPDAESKEGCDGACADRKGGWEGGEEEMREGEKEKESGDGNEINDTMQCRVGRAL